VNPNSGFSLRAPAKVNLSLRVVGRQAGGYHRLESLVAFAELGDVIHFAPAQAITLEVRGPFAGELTDPDDNLILKAAARLAERGEGPLGASMILDKALPVASGIGGGSADAAAALVGLCRLWGLDVEVRELAEIARALGADVPMCLAGVPAWVTGIGETLEPVPDFPRLPAVLANPGRPLSTAAVFAARHGPFADPTPPPRFNGGAALVEWLAGSGNDLEAPARELEPEIGRVLEALAACFGCRLARMSGSGATCFGLFETPAAARAAAQRLAVAEGGWWVRATALGHPGDARDATAQ
jgi:4-diphosphocytidyl-2-C-methyl-D-erythritol kinase